MMRRKNAPFARVPCLFLAVCLLLSLLPGTALAGGDPGPAYAINSHQHYYNEKWPEKQEHCGDYVHDTSITYDGVGTFTLNGFHGELMVETTNRPLTIELVGDDNVLTEFNPPQYASPTNPAITFVGNDSVTLDSRYLVTYTLIIGGDGTRPKITADQYGMGISEGGSIDLRSGELHLKNTRDTAWEYAVRCNGSRNPQITLAPGAVLTAEGAWCAASVSLTGNKGPRSGLDNHNVTVTGRNGEKLY